MHHYENLDYVSPFKPSVFCEIKREWLSLDYNFIRFAKLISEHTRYVSLSKLRCFNFILKREFFNTRE